MGRVRAQPRNGAAFVAWHAADGHGLPITGYSVKIGAHGGSTTIASVDLGGSATSTTVPGCDCRGPERHGGGPRRRGFVTVWPTGTPRPNASNLNFRPGQSPIGVYPNAVTVKLGHDRKVSLFNAVGSTNLLLDVAGYYLDAGLPAAATYQAVSPHRALDTRAGIGAPQEPVGEGRVVELAVGGVGGLPADGLDSVVLNVTAVAPTATSYLTAWPTGGARPNASWQTRRDISPADPGRFDSLNDRAGPPVTATVAVWHWPRSTGSRPSTGSGTRAWPTRTRSRLLRCSSTPT